MTTSGDVRVPAERFQERTVVLVLVDLAGFTRAVGHLRSLEIAETVDRFYAICGDCVAGHGGQVIKFSGDNCLAMFESAAATNAVAFAVAVRADVGSMAQELQLDLDVGANVHLATVAVGTFGASYAATLDVAGLGVIHTYRLGSGAGIRISEPVYRKLPSGERSPWRKHQPLATYTLER